MRVGPLLSAGSPLRRLLLLALLCCLAVPAAARAQEQATVRFDDAPTGVTSSTSERFSFSAEGAASYACALDGAAPAPCAPGITVSDLGAGSHTFAVQALGAEGGVVADGQVTWVVDLDRPTAEILSGPEGRTPVGPASVTFRSRDADVVRFECSLDGRDFASCESPTQVTVEAGDHSFAVRAVDAAGNVGEPDSSSWTGIPPAPELDGPPELTRSRSATFTFSAPGAEGYECVLDQGMPAACASPHEVTELDDGLHTLSVRGIAAGGEPGDFASLSWTVDTTAPGVTIAPFPGRPQDITNEREASFVFGTSDATATLACSLDGAAFRTCASGVQVTVEESGTHTFTVRATDEAGNASTDTDTWIVDDELPSVTFVAAPAPVTNEPTAEFRLRADAGVDLFCRLVGPGRGEDEELVRCEEPQRYSGLTSGDYTLEVQAIDAAGNVATASRSWRVDLIAPVITFQAAPPEVTTDPTVQLAFAGSEELEEVRCTLDGAPVACAGGATVPNVVLGTHTFTVTATDAAGNPVDPVTASRTWTTSFTAAFDWSPADAVIDQPVTFSSRSAGAITGQAWDLDDDGQFDDGTGMTAQRTFSEPSTYVVRLRVTHASGEPKETRATVAVGRTPLTADPPVTAGTSSSPPVAAFTVAPQAPVAGQDVTLSSTSSDPDGPIASTAWDLDGDGAFDDATGATVSPAFPAGAHVVGLRVTDADGLEATAFATVTVEAAPGAPKPPAVPPAPKALGLLKPFPTVRIAGTAVGGRIRLRIFAVRAPRNTTVDVRCRGRGCPFTRDRRSVRGKTRTVRFRRLERRGLRAGIVLEVRVHAAGRMGKYTRLFMRAGAAPKRTDACVSGMKTLKVACPA